MGDNYEDLFEPSQKKILRIGIPSSIQTPLIFTLVSAIIGVILQFFETPSNSFPQTMTNFFTSNYANWIISFGNFTSETFYSSYREVVIALLSHWYYFLLTGGYISLIVGVISWLIHLEIVFKLPFTEKTNKINETLIVPIKKEQPKITPSSTPITPQKKKTMEEEQNERITQLTEQGVKLLAKKDISGAEIIYHTIEKEYDPKKDSSKNTYKKILDLYAEINKAK